MIVKSAVGFPRVDLISSKKTPIPLNICVACVHVNLARIKVF